MGRGGPLAGETLSSALRRYLSAELARRVDARGVVVWVDAHREYEEVAQALCPPQTRFLRWQGSWYRLRRELDELVAGAEPPRLVVYQPVPTPPEPEDPLAEVRLGGTEFDCRLSTLVRDALAGQLPPPRVEQIAQARTFQEAEAALASGATVGVRLPSALGTGDPREMVLRLLADEYDARLGELGLWGEARETLRHLLGVQLEGEGQRVRNAAFRHLVFVELAQAGWKPPSGFAESIEALSSDQRRLCLEVIRAWRGDARRRASYRACAVGLERELRLRGAITWNDAFADLDTLPVLEELAHRAALQRLRDGREREALELAGQRLRSIWAASEVPEAAKWHLAWKAAEAVARLLSELQAHPVPAASGIDAALTWYVDGGWRVDRAHRAMEDALTQLAVYGELEEPVTRARSAYEAWLGQLLERFTESVASEPWQTRLLSQWEVHKARLSSIDGPTAYMLVDALRFELGLEVADALRSAAVGEEVEVVAAVTAVPTVTAVGMASLLPGAERGLRVSLSGDGRLEVAVDGIPVRTVSDRVALLRAAHGQVVDLLLAEVLERSESQLREQLSGARLVVVRSQEVDETLETDHTATLRNQLGELPIQLVRAIERLTAAGVSRFVVTGDHGFLLLSRPPASSMLLEPPGGAGVLRDRCWVGKGGITPPAALRLPLSHFGVAGDLDLVVPRGLAAFRSRRFLHEGLSPQELVVPVITVRTRAVPTAGGTRVKVQVVGGRMTTGVFSAALALEPNLFAAELQVRLRVQDPEGREAGRPIAGQGYDEQSATVRLRAAEREQILTFRITRSLPKGSRIVLEAHDAGGQLVGRAEAPVVAHVEVDHEPD